MEQYPCNVLERQMTGAAASWSVLKPLLHTRVSRAALLEHAQALSRASNKKTPEQALAEARDNFTRKVRACRRSDRQALLATGLVILDLTAQGWVLRVRANQIQIKPPAPLAGDHRAEKSRIRGQELLKRNAQLNEGAVQAFLQSAERRRVFNGKFVSIFSLMRDGRELAAALLKARAHLNNGWAGALAEICDPYIQFVADEATCRFTGLRLMDIWRYFRHTWTNQYTSVPGRTMLFLVRDRAAALHPVIGIGALSSPIMQIRERDTWIGWHPDAFLARLKSEPTERLAAWLISTVESAIAEIYVDDLLEDRIISPSDLSNATSAAITKLLEDSKEQRRLHHRYARSIDHKQERPADTAGGHWVAKARTHLFRSKRALALAAYLRARGALKEALGSKPTAAKLVALASTGDGADVIRKILKKAKADRIGIAVADITVCGAVQPYNAILGGKLVAMLATSPEVVGEYKRRYDGAESEIASSMAGRPITRSPSLVLLGTTSLYGVGSSQYNRIKIPCDRLGGSPMDVLSYDELGRSESFGTSQYSEETLEALTDLVQQSADGQRVNSIFGEGASPKMRKVRQALDTLGLPSELLLRHHRPRVVYGVRLVHNLGDYLLGLDSQPRYLTSPTHPEEASEQIAAWWRERWLRHRILSDEVLEEVSRHTLVHPICHGARVCAPRRTDQQSLFPDAF
jgi:Domain of unknown function (DUF4338)